MKCPFCGAQNSAVIETKPTDSQIRRRRECDSCGKRFTTYEEISLKPINIIKRNGRAELFNEEKLIRSISLAANKTSLTMDDIQELVDAIILQIRQSGKLTISSKELGSMVLSNLSAKNEVAYIRFASVYGEFQTIEDFISEIKSFKKTKGK